MAVDPVLVANTRAWLSFCRDASIWPRMRWKRVVMFHSQQAAEKALKGFLTWHDVPFRKVHGLDVLGEQCVELDASLNTLVDQAKRPSAFAWRKHGRHLL